MRGAGRFGMRCAVRRANITKQSADANTGIRRRDEEVATKKSSSEKMPLSDRAMGIFRRILLEREEDLCRFLRQLMVVKKEIKKEVLRGTCIM